MLEDIDGKPVSVNHGHLALKDGKVVASTPKLTFMEGMKIRVETKEIDSEKEPENFLRNLHLACHSPYLTAMKAEEESPTKGFQRNI